MSKIRFLAKLRPAANHKLLGIPPTGKPVAVSGIVIDRYADGKVVEGWGFFDRLELLQQLGVVPQGLEQ